MSCRTGCPEFGSHKNWGACARAAHLRIGYANSAAGIDLTREKRFQAENDAYERAVNAGMNPDTTTFEAVRQAELLSEGSGVAYGTPAWDGYVQEKLSEGIA